MKSVLAALALTIAVMVWLPALAAAAGPSRGALWNVIRACLLMQSTTGQSFPCVEAKRPPSGDGGFAVLKSPRYPPEFLVTPADRVTGIESSAAGADAMRATWQAAWATRAYVADRLGEPLSKVDVGLAVNSKGSRTQDQFHIHVDCVSVAVRSLIGLSIPDDPFVWQRLPARLGGRQFWIERLAATDLQQVNIISEVRRMPAAAAAMQKVSVATLSGGKQAPDAILLLMSIDNGQAENVLDHQCRDASVN